MHGPTFMGNALACSVSLAAIELFERDDYMSKIHHLESIAKETMRGFSHESIKEIRIMGGCVCIEVKNPATLKGYQEYAYKKGVFARPFLNFLYTMFPYVLTDEELILILNTMKEWFE